MFSQFFFLTFQLYAILCKKKWKLGNVEISNTRSREVRFELRSETELRFLLVVAINVASRGPNTSRCKYVINICNNNS